MKKLVFMVFILFVSMGVMLSQTITVTSPAAGSIWDKGSTHNITWRSSGCRDTSIKINIFRNSILEANFVEQLLCTDTGSKSWTIPLSYTAGNYILRVKTADNLCRGDSGLFEIRDVRDLTETPEINITSPTSSSDWKRGTLKNITWTKSGDMHGRVKIHLMNSGGTTEVLTISSNTLNDLNHLWLVPASQATGSYRIRIQTFDRDPVTDTSPAFDIIRTPSLALQQNTVIETRGSAPGSTQPVIKVVYPNGGETITRGSRVEIRWECVDGFNPPKIKIQKNGRTIREYSSPRVLPVPSRDGYIWPWFVPSDLAPGSDYKVRIEKGDFSRSNDVSDRNFTISSDLNIEVVEPRGSGLTVTNGTFIRWRAGGVSSNVNIELHSTDRRGGPYTIRSNVPVTPSRFLWYVGALEGSTSSIFSRDHYKIVVSATDGSVSGESNVFQIVKPTLEVIAPNGGEKRPGDNLNIRWNNSPGFHGDVKIILQRQSGSTWFQYEVLFPSTHDKNVDWTIYSNRGATRDPIPTGTYYRIRIESVRCPKEIIAIGERFYLR